MISTPDGSIGVIQIAGLVARASCHLFGKGRRSAPASASGLSVGSRRDYTCLRAAKRWSPRARRRWRGKRYWPISGLVTAAVHSAPINHFGCETLSQLVAMAEVPGACYSGVMQMPTDPKYPELRRRRFRPIPVRMLVPNFITLLAICAGLTAICLSTEGRMELAVAAIVFAGLCWTASTAAWRA